MQSSFRLATINDADFVYNLRNSPDVRNISWNTEYIHYTDHLKFFKEHYKEYRIIISQEQMVGFIRVNNGNISIVLDREHRNMGIGSMVLKYFIGRAEIKLGNPMSLYAFINAGFKITGWVVQKEK